MGKNKNRFNSYILSYFEAIYNLFIFFPYFFSVGPLFKTLFLPWKKIVSVKASRGFSISEFFNNLMFDIISRSIGFAMRISLILFYVLLQIFFILITPFIIIFAVISSPFILLTMPFTKNEEEKTKDLKDGFISLHSLKDESKNMVASWFDLVYEERFHTKPWYDLKTLMNTPPLARDWAVGYTPNLDEFSINLTSSEYQKNIRNHIVGREAESNLIEQALSSSSEANALLVGNEGVGRHTIIETLSKKVYEGKINNLLSYKRILQLNMEKILAEYTDSKSRENFMESLLYEASYSRSVILVIDNFERYCSTSPNHFDLSLSLEKYGKSNYLQIIGITTPFAYEKYIFNNSKIRNIFTKIDFEEISKDKALYILMEKVLEFEAKHSIIIPYETIVQVVEKSNFFITNIPFPEKALQLLDDICVFAAQNNKKIVLPEIVDTVLTNKTHIPTTLNDEIKNKLLNLEKLLAKRIIGQDEALSELSSTMRRSFLLIGKRKKPISSFLFLGPTGVGKTETAKVLAEVFFGSFENLLRFDMSLFQSKTDVDKLIGSIENLNPGLLTNSIREKPYGILLLDEIEKAHPDILNIFLTIIDEGYFTDGFGQTVDCKNLVIIATSNAGAKHIHELLLRQHVNTLSQNSISSNSIIDYLVENSLFSPEFLNRFDGVVAYKPIQEDSVNVLAINLVEQLKNIIYENYKVHINVKEETIKEITQKGYEKQFGVRNLQRILRQNLEDKIAKNLLEGRVKEGDTLML